MILPWGVSMPVEWLGGLGRYRSCLGCGGGGKLGDGRLGGSAIGDRVACNRDCDFLTKTRILPGYPAIVEVALAVAIHVTDSRLLKAGSAIGPRGGSRR